MEALRPGWAVRVIIVMVITAVFFRCVNATNHSVGGSSGWDLSSNILDWSAANSFQVDDYLVFKYSQIHDVLEVNRTEFTNCRTVNPISTHTDGLTVIYLNQPGTRYFICGRLDHCSIGLKLRAQVLQRFSHAYNSTIDGVDQEDRRNPRRPPRHSLPPFEPLPFPGTPAAPSPCNCSGVGEFMMNWWLVLFLVRLATAHLIGFVSADDLHQVRPISNFVYQFSALLKLM